jgi:peptidoglycan/xylan/chitin deacetylase (PgdA/CDA1 family)
MDTRNRTPGGLRRAVSLQAVRVLQSAPVTSIARRITVDRLRILAFHGVDDLTHFERVTGQILERYAPVDGSDIVAALEGTRPLPPHAVWFTFDDGIRGTLDAAEMLAGHGVRATAFVNPAPIESPSLLWFQVLAIAEQHGIISELEAERFSRHRLKSCPDAERRAAVAELEERVADLPSRPTTLSGDVAALGRWVDMGHEVGNHTWDHPCLDMCDGGEQMRQIEKAHSWLVDHGFDPRFFAYPNGNWAEESEATVRRLGYRASVVFDHHLEDLRGNPQRLSRLRISSSADPRRAASILSGAHSGAYGLSRRLAAWGG